MVINFKPGTEVVFWFSRFFNVKMTGKVENDGKKGLVWIKTKDQDTICIAKRDIITFKL